MQYQFRLKAQNRFGFSQNWSQIAIITANARPDPVQIPSTALYNKTNVMISWSAPSDNYSPI
jgi:hypothetical protein